MSELDPAHPTEVVNCPHCGATVEYQRGVASVKCHYCGQAVPVPDAPRPVNVDAAQREALNVIEVVPATVTMPQRRRSGIGCMIGIIGFVVFMILVTVVLPLALTANVMNNIPQMPAALQEMATAAVELKREPTRRAPTPAPSPTPGFLNVAATFGSEGTGPGYFTAAHAIGVDGKGRVYVGEYEGGRIQIFEASGKFVDQWFAGDKKTLLLGFAVDRNGVVYVADGENITRYDGSSGKILGTMKYPDPRFGEVATTPDGGLAAMWYERRNGIFTSTDGAREDLVRFDKQGKVVKVIQAPISSQTEDVELENLLAVDGRGNMYVLSRFAGSVFKFSPEGKLITRFGSEGNQPGQFSDAQSIAIDQRNRVYVSDNNGITVFNADGGYLTTVPLHDSVSAMAFDNKNNLWAVGYDKVIQFVLKDAK